MHSLNEIGEKNFELWLYTEMGDARRTDTQSFKYGFYLLQASENAKLMKYHIFFFDNDNTSSTREGGEKL